MAKATPGFWTVWLWKLGMWGFVILFAVLYLGSVERHRSAAEGGPAAEVEPVAAPGGVLVVDLPVQAAPVDEGLAFAEPEESGQVEASVPAPPGEMSDGPDQAASGQNDPISKSASHAEAQAFANAVMSRPGAETVDAGPKVTIVPAPGPTPVVAPGLESQADVSGVDVDGAEVATRETAAQRHARMMEEYRAMQRAAREEMRTRWSSMGGGYPYGAYPQWGYPPGIAPRGYAPAGQ